MYSVDSRQLMIISLRNDYHSEFEFFAVPVHLFGLKK